MPLGTYDVSFAVQFDVSRATASKTVVCIKNESVEGSSRCGNAKNIARASADILYILTM